MIGEIEIYNSTDILKKYLYNWSIKLIIQQTGVAEAYIMAWHSCTKQSVPMFTYCVYLSRQVS